jgi:hypothetical protein
LFSFSSSSVLYVLIDETLPIENKPKHPKKGENKEQKFFNSLIASLKACFCHLSFTIKIALHTHYCKITYGT